MFLENENTMGELESAIYIEYFIKVIHEVGSQIVQFIADNAPSFKLVGSHVETRYSHIFWTPYVVPRLNQALKIYL